MILGALVAAGVDPIGSVINSLLGVEGFSVSFETVNKSGLSANYARVETAHEHKHRHLSDIRKIIDDSATLRWREATLDCDLHPISGGRSTGAQRAN